MYAHTQTFLPKDHGRSIVQLPSYLSSTSIHINSALGGSPRALAHMSDSLVRVSRRDDKRHFVRVSQTHDSKTDPYRFRSFSRVLKKDELAADTGDHRQHCLSSVPFQQFQVLFHSFFKVLCIFPSRYLFAIGLPPIFSFRWNLPPT